ncbi:MAG TPA: dienelactone hydrolase family protein [Pseudolabrys sp.]|nr:dienelactone hydrolase family protein [Pseudolabrys sp.]
MGKQFSLTTTDHHTLGAYRADPSGAAKGGIVVVQEIFGVNRSIRAVCDAFAAQGYAAVAPAVFDRFERNFDSGYTPDEVAHARSFIGKLNWDWLMADVAAAHADLKSVGPTAVVGFCLGGSVAFLSACRLEGLKAGVGYYGGAIVKFADEKPKCPVQLHFGDQDTSIPVSDIEVIKQKQPQAEVHVYPGAPHAFANEDRPSYRREAADLAWNRTLEFLKRTMK